MFKKHFAAYSSSRLETKLGSYFAPADTWTIVIKDDSGGSVHAMTNAVLTSKGKRQQAASRLPTDFFPTRSALRICLLALSFPVAKKEAVIVMDKPIVYLMRGLPGSGKSHTAKGIAGETGLVLETDEFFYTQAGEDPSKYDYDSALLPAAQEWNLARFRTAVLEGRMPIVVDRGNGLNAETREYVVFALAHGYEVQLREPDSPWWQELRELLKHKSSVTEELLDQWAEFLSSQTRAAHRVPAATIRRWMRAWKHDLTVEEIRDFR